MCCPLWGVDIRKVAAVARTHHGLITLQQARALDITDDAWRRAVRSGRLEGLFAGVARLAGSPETRLQRILAAVYAGGDGAVASHRTAALLWGVPRPDDDPIDVIIPRPLRSMPRGVVVHRPTDRADLRATLRYGIPTVPPVRMLLDLGAVDRPAVASALDTLLRQRTVRLDVVRGAVASHSRQGRSGIVALRRAVEARSVDGRPVDSDLEVRMATLRRRYGLPPMEFHATVLGYEVDFLVSGTKVVVECDGWQWHGLDRDQFEFDRARDAQLLAGGFVTVRVTWRQLTREPARVAQRIRHAITAFSERKGADTA